MKKMNKEDLINYFISALGDNRYLEKIISNIRCSIISLRDLQ